MRAEVSAAILAASLLCGHLTGQRALAACPPGSARNANCVNLDAVPQISQQVITKEPLLPAAKTTAETVSEGSYTGPTLGLAPGVRRAPAVGYRWAID